MILSNEELFKALDSGRLVITPEPTPRRKVVGAIADYCPFDSDAVDLRLGTEITIPEPGKYIFDPTQKEPLAPFIEKNSRRESITAERQFILKPQQFILAQTLEKVQLPVNHPINKQTNTCLAARIEGKSSHARMGLLIHFTAPTVHTDWSGPLTLEMINLGPVGVLLSLGMPIAQLIVEEVKGLPAENRSQFHEQATPAGVPKS